MVESIVESQITIAMDEEIRRSHQIWKTTENGNSCGTYLFGIKLNCPEYGGYLNYPNTAVAEKQECQQIAGIS